MAKGERAMEVGESKEREIKAKGEKERHKQNREKNEREERKGKIKVRGKRYMNDDGERSNRRKIQRVNGRISGQDWQKERELVPNLKDNTPIS